MGGMKARIAIGLALIALGVWALGRYAHGSVEALAGPLVAQLGLPGIFVATMLGDPMPGIGFQPSLLVGYTGGVHVALLLVVVSGASLVASAITFAAGRALKSAERIQALLVRGRVSERLAGRRGGAALVIAAMGPLPWGLAVLGAGASGIPMRTVALAAAARLLKIGATLTVIALGWGAP